jgi:hypothetical protein
MCAYLSPQSAQLAYGITRRIFPPGHKTGRSPERGDMSGLGNILLSKGDQELKKAGNDLWSLVASLPGQDSNPWIANTCSVLVKAHDSLWNLQP